MSDADPNQSSASRAPRLPFFIGIAGESAMTHAQTQSAAGFLRSGGALNAVISPFGWTTAKRCGDQNNDAAPMSFRKKVQNCALPVKQAGGVQLDHPAASALVVHAARVHARNPRHLRAGRGG